MASGTDRTRALSVRALVIFYALLSLCVSDTVGPRLLPLPEAAARTAADRQAVESTGLNPTPSRGDSAVAREAIAPAARRQAGTQRHSLHVAAGVAEGLVEPPTFLPSSARAGYSSAPQSSAALTRPPGRAPPLSV